MDGIVRRRVARAMKPGGPEVLSVEVEEMPPLQAHQVLVRVQAAGLNHVESLVRSGGYPRPFPFPYAAGFEGAGRVEAVGSSITIPIGARVCWTAVFGSCATHVAAPAAFLAVVPDEVPLEKAAALAHAAVTAEGLVRHCPLPAGACAVVWGAAGSVGRQLVCRLVDRGVQVIGLASADRVEAVRALGARPVDRGSDDVGAVVREETSGRGAAAVFDPIGAATFERSLALLAPRGCLVTYGQLSGPVPPIDLMQLMQNGSVFVTRYGPHAGVVAPNELAPITAEALRQSRTRPLSAGVAHRFALDRVADAYRAMEAGARGKVLVLP